MKKRQSNLGLLLQQIGIFIMTIGMSIIILLSVVTHQKLTNIFALLSIVALTLGLYLMFCPPKMVKKIDNFFEGWNTLEILLYIGGSLLVVIGIGNLIFFGFGYYQELSLFSPVKYFTIMVLSFLFVYFGFFVAHFRIIISGWITEFFQKRKKQQA